MRWINKNIEKRKECLVYTDWFTFLPSQKKQTLFLNKCKITRGHWFFISKFQSLFLLICWKTPPLNKFWMNNKINKHTERSRATSYNQSTASFLGKRWIYGRANLLKSGATSLIFVMLYLSTFYAAKWLLAMHNKWEKRLSKEQIIHQILQ